MSFNPEANHAPTPQRIRRAQQEGHFVRSRDLVWAGIWIASFCALTWFGETIVGNWRELTRHAWSPNQPMNLSTVVDSATEYQAFLLELLPLVLLIAFGALIFNLVQGGLGIFPERVMPRASRLFQRQRSGWFDRMLTATNSILKVISIVSVAGIFVYLKRNQLMQLGEEDVETTYSQGAQVLMAISLQVAIVLGIWGVVDYATSRFSYLRSLRMTDQEIRDEQRMIEGDPRIHSIRQELPSQSNRRFLAANESETQ